MARNTSVTAQRDSRSYNTGRIDTYALTNAGVKKDRHELKKELERRRARDAEMVVVKFKNLETPGGVLRFSYKRYAQDHFEKYEFFDGEVYQIPRGVRNHIANGCYSLVYQPLAGEGKFAIQAATMSNQNKNVRMMATKKQHRFQCLGLDYMDDDLDGLPNPELTQITMDLDATLK